MNASHENFLPEAVLCLLCLLRGGSTVTCLLSKGVLNLMFLLYTIEHPRASTLV
jgi:hypothetical protein